MKDLKELLKNSPSQVVAMPNSDYHGSSALGSTNIKAALKSLGHFKAQMLGEVKKESRALEIGTAAHSAILEQDYSNYICGPDVSKATKVWKEFVKENEGKIVLKPSEYEMIKGMFEAYFSHPNASKLTHNGQAEQSFFCTDEKTGLALKARTDYYVQHEDGDFIVDYKTASSANAREFSKAIWNFRYDLSAAHYMDVVERVTGRKVKNFFWVVQEKEAPYAIQIFKADPEMLFRAEKKRRELLDSIKTAIETETFPAYDDKISVIDTPRWAEED